jgi:molybdopterin-containing oxidoreductase family iron-sulfur binding subunit
MKEPDPNPEKNERRNFLKALLSGSAVAAALGASPETAKAANPATPLEKLPEGDSLILRMQRELHRAISKPVEKRRWVMVIDLRKCIGCSACTIGCVAENKLPPGVVYRPVMEEEIGEYPNVTRRFLPRLCNQCDNPPCVPVCPVKATYKRPDGIVEIDYDQCIGCRYCLPACPYGARTADFGESYTSGTPEVQAYENQPNFEYGKEWSREHGKSPVGNARKCHFCLHRLNVGMLPACVTTCIGYATYFGDADDPDSLVSELIVKPNVMRLKEELGTKPRVYYLT